MESLQRARPQSVFHAAYNVGWSSDLHHLEPFPSPRHCSEVNEPLLPQFDLPEALFKTMSNDVRPDLVYLLQLTLIFTEGCLK
jgi:hypothetical protein